MEVNDEVVLGSCLRHLVVEPYTLLVVTVHEVNLEPFDAHLAIVPAHLLHVSLHRIIACPKNQADTSFFCISTQLLKAYLRNDLEQIRLLVDSPALVKYHVLNVVGSRKVDVVLVCVVVNTRLEVNTFDVPIVPPVPRHLAGLYPTDVFDPCWRGKLISHVVVQ